MELFGTLTVSNALVRKLAIQCHALDNAAPLLFIDTTLDDKSGATKLAYEALYSEALLSLAISLRTLFYQGVDHKATKKFIQNCGILLAEGDEYDELEEYTAKDVCDKIIHAKSFNRTLGIGSNKPTTHISGTTQNGKEWKLSLSVGLFAEGVLNWLESSGAA